MMRASALLGGRFFWAPTFRLGAFFLRPTDGEFGEEEPGHRSPAPAAAAERPWAAPTLQALLTGIFVAPRRACQTKYANGNDGNN